MSSAQEAVIYGVFGHSNGVCIHLNTPLEEGHTVQVKNRLYKIVSKITREHEPTTIFNVVACEFLPR